ncbi:hypothetical protein MPLB_1990018 [Mesorhizobium sp. ORS 3324]|nr:hypothetical protein MPLB_1990018 [Mesorhizobium sp. ORS 3324]
MRKLVAGKLHGIHVTEANLNYHGSITLDPDHCEAAGITMLHPQWCCSPHLPAWRPDHRVQLHLPERSAYHSAETADRHVRPGQPHKRAPELLGRS